MPTEVVRDSSDEETPYDVFVSYARKDNNTGWLSALVEQLSVLEPAVGAAPLRIFFDTEEIEGMDLWRQRIEGALRRSRVLLVCLSPSWRDSITCRWEWQAYFAARAGRRAGVPAGLAIVWLADLPTANPASPPGFDIDVLPRVHDTQTLLDLRPGSVAAALKSPQVWVEPAGQRELRRIADRLWCHVGREREASRAQGNLRSGNSHFVGRTRELSKLHHALTLGRPGVISAVQGLGGIGKTELAVQYAYEYAWHYTSGLWQLNAEGHAQLLPLLATLAQNSNFLLLHGQVGEPLKFTPEEQVDSTALGRAVAQAMLRRAHQLRDDERQALARVDCTREPAGGGAVLLILDNVDQSGLLSQRELSGLPELNQARERLRVIATTRIGRDQLSASGLEVIALGCLSDDEARALMLTHRRGRPYPDAAYEANVERILELLGGYTLVVEQVAVYLALNPTVSPQALLEAFTAQGLTLSDGLLTTDPRLEGQILHPERLFGIVLGQTLKSLDAVPLARAALEFAAWLPPEHISWLWLEKLVKAGSPQDFQHENYEPSPWTNACDRLRAAQLLTDVGPGVAGLHRLIGDHLRRRANASSDDTSKRVDEFADDVSRRLYAEFEISPVQLQDELAALRALAEHCRQSGRTGPIVARIAGIVATIELRVGSFALAGRLSEYAVVLYEADVQSDPELRRGLTSAYDGLARFLIARGLQGDADRAFHLRERSLEICEALVLESPASAQAHRDVSVSLKGLAESLEKGGGGGGKERALRLLERSLEICKALLGHAARDVSVDHNVLAAFFLRRRQAGDLEHARTHYESSLGIREDLYRKNPESAQAKRDLAINLSTLADLLDGSGEAAEVLSYRERSLQHFQALLAGTPCSIQATRDVVITLERQAGALCTSDRLAALDHYRLALGLSRQIAENGAAGSYELIRTLATSLFLSCRCAQAAGEAQEARQYREDFVALLARWQRRGGVLDPEVAGWLAQFQRE